MGFRQLSEAVWIDANRRQPGRLPNVAAGIGSDHGGDDREVFRATESPQRVYVAFAYVGQGLEIEPPGDEIHAGAQLILGGEPGPQLPLFGIL